MITQAVEAEIGQREYWPVLALLGLIILLIEWIVYQRRMHAPPSSAPFAAQGRKKMNDVRQAIKVSTDELAALCRKYHVRKLSLFGSVLSDDFRSDSDLDILVEYEPEAHIGLDFIAFQHELSILFGRSVDLNTPIPSALSPECHPFSICYLQ